MSSMNYEVNGKKVVVKPSHSRFKRTAHQIRRDIYNAFEKIGITQDYIDLDLPRNPLKREKPAEICWYVNGKDHYYSCDTQENYRDNLGVISKVIIQDCYAIRNGMKSFAQVMNQFALGFDENAPKIKSAREIIGVPQDCKDLEYITFKYKKKAKKLHSDLGGSDEKMAELNKAFKDIKRELEGK